MIDSRIVTVLVTASLMIGYSSQQDESYYFTNSQQKRPSFGPSYQQQTIFLGERDIDPQQYHFQNFQPAGTFAVSHQPAPFKPSGFVSHLQPLGVQPLPQSQFSQRHPSNTGEQFLGQVTLQAPQIQKSQNNFPYDVPPFKPQITFKSQTEKSIPKYHQSIQPSIQQYNRFTAQRARPFSAESSDYEFDNQDDRFQHRNRFKSKPTTAAPVRTTTHRIAKSYGTPSSNKRPFNYQQYLDEAARAKQKPFSPSNRFENTRHAVVDNQKISITTHSAYGNIKDIPTESTTIDEYYDEDTETSKEDEIVKIIPETTVSPAVTTSTAAPVTQTEEVTNEEDPTTVLIDIPGNLNTEDIQTTEEERVTPTEVILQHEDTTIDDSPLRIMEDVDIGTESEPNIEELLSISEEEIKKHHENDEHEMQNDGNGFDVLTMGPITTVEKDNFKKFVDSSSIDTSEMLALLDLVDKSEIKINNSGKSESLDEEPNLEKPETKPEEEDPESYVISKEVVSVVTTKSVINGTISIPVTPPTLVTEQMVTPHVQENVPKEEMVSNTELNEANNTTESWVVVASVQTSRSVSGARFLPFPSVEQDERIEKLSDLEEKVHDKDESLEIETTTENMVTESTTLKMSNVQDDKAMKLPAAKVSNVDGAPIPSTESIIDKLDQLQSELSSGLLTRGFNNISDNFAILTDMRHLEKATPAPPAVVIKKFTRPTTTIKPKTRQKLFENVKVDALDGLLPANFKPRNSFIRPITTTTEKSFKLLVPDIKHRNGTTGRSLGQTYQNKIIVLDVNTLLPKSETIHPKSPSKINKTEDENTTRKNNPLDKILGAAKPVDISAFLPPGYKEKVNEETTKQVPLPKVKIADISAFLPPGYKETVTEENTKEVSLPKIKVADISAFLPPGYKEKVTEENTKEVSLPKIKVDDISAFLPPGYKEKVGKESTKEVPLPKIQVADISAFLPKDFKPENTTEKSTLNADSLLSKINFQDVSAFLPKEYTPSAAIPETPSTTEAAPSTTTAGSFKVVFPSRPGGRKPIHRITTPHPGGDGGSGGGGGGGAGFKPTIRKGAPVRATTEFTGWPTPSTTPISIEKLLELQRNKAISLAGDSFLPQDYTPNPDDESTTRRTTTTTTEEPTTTMPTTTHAPGICDKECSLAGTIRLIGGTNWVPELLDHNTKEWQILANDVLTQLEDVYSKSTKLRLWYKKIRIDGFSEGSVLVDYYVELTDLVREVDTLEVKKYFHEAMQPVKNFTELKSDKEDNKLREESGEKLALGKFIVDPKSTDFIVLPKLIPTVGYAEDDVLLPQWAIAVVVIGLASLCFVIIFGVTVLVNRQKNNKKKNKSVIPLTEDMLQELNKNHMGGVDNYGAEDLYNVNLEDNWNQPYQKQKRSVDHDNSMSNLYDSWRSQWNRPSQFYAQAQFQDVGEEQFYGTHSPYHGSHTSQHQYGHPRRRPDYDTNF